MAIEFEKRKSGVNYLGIALVIFFFGFLALGAYFLFFAPTPQFDQIVPSSLMGADQLSSQLKFIDPNTVLESPKFRDLKRYPDNPGVGLLGRPNPFIDVTP